MKVILVNGSPREKGCTYTALSEVAKTLNENGIETEIFHIGTESVAGCIACGVCRDSGECIYTDCVSGFLEKAKNADGFVFGSPVYYSNMSGQLSSFMDRAFYSGAKYMNGKPAAAVVSCRRGGASSTFEQINKYFTINCMPVVSSQYWNQVHGSKAEDVLKDEEGMQTMRTLGAHMAWLLKCIEIGKANGIDKPEKEPAIRTSFIR